MRKINKQLPPSHHSDKHFWNFPAEQQQQAQDSFIRPHTFIITQVYDKTENED